MSGDEGIRAAALEGGRRVEVRWPNGATRVVSALWLFDHAEGARNPLSGQRRHGAGDLAGQAVEDVAVEGGRIVLRFPGGERRLALSALRAPAEAAGPPAELWLAPPAALHDLTPFDAYLGDDAALARALDQVRRLGLVLLAGAGAAGDAVERAAARFGYVRETNYGRTFDVRVTPEPGNLAYSERALDLHADNPYRASPPTLQLLHAIAADPAGGGETLFVDGFAHAEALRRAEPAAFDRLAREPVRFTYREASGACWSATAPVLELDARGGLLGVRLNHRSLDLALDEADGAEAWYEAYLEFHRRLHDPPAAFVRRLAPGEMAIFDNRRILHGRSAIHGGGGRWLRGAYADVDGLSATLARLGGAGPATA
jgi:gamma-butyrobetaine dioxygenase